MVSVRGGTPKPCKHHHAHNPVESREVLATLLPPLTGSVIVGRTCGSSPGGGRSAPVRPKDRGLNGIKTPERTRPTSAPGYMPRHPTPRTLKPLAVREVDGGVNLRYPRPAPVGIFVTEERAVHAHLLSCLPPLLALSSLPQTIIYPYWLGFSFRGTLMRAAHQGGQGCQRFG